MVFVQICFVLFSNLRKIREMIFSVVPEGNAILILGLEFSNFT